MDPDKLAQWRQADALFDQWLDLPESDRDAWLAAHTAPDPVRRRLDQLIAAHLQPSAALDPARGSLAGRRLGEWTLEEELGRGGMAVVHRAWRERGTARQQAAVKVLTLGALGAAGRERFQREAEILARLNHPNAAALIDSGVADDGTCWLAMPLVEGERIDRWCDAHAPDAHAIVRLYLQVCGAVAYAHRSLVIHRDIKPSNVLVDAAGHARLLDFGIGQFADAAGERTQTLWRALTPGYAAPEQLRGDPPATTMDVYGLGALLHRLLTGRTPQAADADGETTTRPSLLVREASDAYHRHYVPLKSDLDRVLLKALAEEPEQRYATADALADDLRRWLDGRPVLAQTPGAGYRLRKFVLRNRGAVAAGVLLAASLAAGVAATLWQAGEARREAANATAQAQRALLVRDFLARVFESTEPASGGVPTALELLDEGARRARADVMETDPLAAADILMLTGQARSRLTAYDEAQSDLETALELLQRHAPAAAGDQMQLRMDLSELFATSGRIEAAIEHANSAIALADTSGAAPADSLRARKTLAAALMFAQPEDAEAQARALVDDIVAAGLADTPLHGEAVTIVAGAMLQARRDRGEVLRMLEQELALWRRVHGADSSAYAHLLADNSAIFFGSGELERGGRMLHEAAAIAERLYTQPHSTMAVIQCHLGAHAYLEGKPGVAARHYDQGLAIDAATARQNLASAECSRYRAIVRATLGDHDGALLDLDRSLSLRRQNQVLEARTTRSVCGLRASILLRQRRLDAAAGALDACPATDQAGASLWYSMAGAELAFARGEADKASELVAALRKTPQENAPQYLDRSWMRPWMLSVLLAHAGGDRNAAAGVAAELGQFATLAPLAQCLAAPGEATCLALP